MIRFSCPSCGMAVSAPEDCAGRSTKCRYCNGPIVVPRIATNRTSPKPVIAKPMSAASPPCPHPETPIVEDTPEARGAAEIVAPLLALTLALAIFGFAGLLVWKYSSSSSPPPENDKQSANLTHRDSEKVVVAVPLSHAERTPNRHIVRQTAFSPKQEQIAEKAPSEPKGEKAAPQIRPAQTPPPQGIKSPRPSRYRPLFPQKQKEVPEKALPESESKEAPPAPQGQMPKPREKTAPSPQPTPPAEVK